MASSRNLRRYLLQAAAFGLVAGLAISVLWPRPRLDSAPPAGDPAAVTAPVAHTEPTANSFAPAVERAAPSVVNIYSTKVITRSYNPLLDDPVFQRFFGRAPVPRQRLESSLGSGVVLDRDGYIVTNHHVIADADEIEVALRDGRSAHARLIGSDTLTDLALLRIDLAQVPAIALGDDQQTRIGDLVLAIGNPFGVGQTVTLGVVGAVGREAPGISTVSDFIQTDAAINPGNSGGALVNSAGELIGINTAIYSRSGGSEGIGFAVPVSTVRQITAQLREHGEVPRGWLGLELQELTPQLAASLGLEDTGGALVAGVYRGSPAARAGVQPGDLLVALEGRTFQRARDALAALATLPREQEVRLTLQRGGRRIETRATTIRQPD
ncbi:MAG: trypsin-like peptidase domain-containing protein [Immundisolibacter sp.]|nr:trypsin-like peptidase domain-containing protein [Immundisolibacter sp.]MEA3220141.1 Periplasmic pH-dependent serine endoprotease DegQ [Immundisolibacter sp.]